MRATAIAQPNIALIKYWGKRDTTRNLPAVGSISITLRDLFTKVSVELDAGLPGDILTVNDQQDDALLPRISACLDAVAGRDRSYARVSSACNFAIAAGLASSAAAFAATTVAAAAAADLKLDDQRLARLAGQASGSAARSLYGGFVELSSNRDDITLTSLCDAEAWPLMVVVAITETAPKDVGSTAAMEISRKTSPFYASWVERQPQDLDTARNAIMDRDFQQLASIAEHNCLKMHSVMWASKPPVVYWNSATIQCLETVRRLQREGCKVFFTIDAGPQVKAVCLPDDAESVRVALAATPGVIEVMSSTLGSAARLVDSE